MLNLKESLEYLEGLPLADYEVIDSKELDKKKIDKLGYPCWLKISSSEHKAKLGGVIKCSSFEDLSLKVKSLSSKFEFPFILQKDFKGIEIMLGIKQDATFGKVLVFGFGGGDVEKIKDLAFLVCPTDREEISKTFQELKVYKMLEEKNYLAKELFSLIEKVSELNIKEADFNPIIVNDKEVKIVDARIEV